MKKYFTNISTPEELKAQFRALSIELHPDRGGDPEEFKAMMAEYMAINKDFDRAKMQQEEEEAARQRAEEFRKQEEERKRKEEEEARRAAEALRPYIEKWTNILEFVEAKKSWYDRVDADYIATVKRNVKRILAKYFPGVKFTVKLKNQIWKEEAAISWVDGPTAEQVEKVAELRYFVAKTFYSDPYADYGDYVEKVETVAWREKFGQISAKGWDLERNFSELGKAEVFSKIYEILPQFDGMTKRSDEARISFNDCNRLGVFLGLKYSSVNWADMSEEERKRADEYDRAHSEQMKECDRLESEYNDPWRKKTVLRRVLEIFEKYYQVSEATTKAAQAAADAIKFTPKHNATYKAIIKALGGNLFAAGEKEAGHYSRILEPLQAAELIAQGYEVYLVKPSTYDGEVCYYGVNLGGGRVQQKRAEKFAAVGVTVYASNYNSFQDVEVLAFSGAVVAELRKDAEQVEQQRKAWEDGRKNGNTAHKADNAADTNKQTDTTAEDAADEAPAEGLELVEIPGGVAVVGDQHTTYRNRKQIKAHGARWNKEAQQWQGTTPEAVASLRKWFGVTEDTADNTSEQEQHQEENTQEQQNTTAENEAMQAAPVVDLLGAWVDLFGELSAAAQKCAEKAQEAANRHTEAEQLRADMAAMRANIQNMGEMLRRMADRLASLEETDGTQGDGAQATEQPEADTKGDNKAA